MLEGELDSHLDYVKHDKQSKQARELPIKVPRDRDASFDVRPKVYNALTPNFIYTVFWIFPLN